MVQLDYTYQLAKNEGDSRKAANKFIILHETGNPSNTGANSAKNEASYMHGNWQNAYTQAIAGWDRVYIVGEPGYVAYGAMSSGNNNSPFQIELARYADKSKALAAYKNWVEIAREMAKKYGIPLTLDVAGNGVKSHKWISDTFQESDHQDPYAYLTTLGISKAQLAADIKNGVGAVVTPPVTPSKPTLKPLATIAKEVIDGKWGNDPSRASKLSAAGYNVASVQAEVNRLLGATSAPKPSLKSNDVIAQEVIALKWGSGQDRINRLTKAGYNASTIQALVNQKLGATSAPKKSINTVAREVIDGKWGNDPQRANALAKAGYNAAAVQAEVNRQLK